MPSGSSSAIGGSFVSHLRGFSLLRSPRQGLEAPPQIPNSRTRKANTYPLIPDCTASDGLRQPRMKTHHPNPSPTYSLHCSSFLGLPYRILIKYLVKPKKGTTMETIGRPPGFWVILSFVEGSPTEQGPCYVGVLFPETTMSCRSLALAPILDS